MALIVTKDTRAMCMATIIVVMAMVVSSPCAMARSLWCGEVRGCTIEKCRFACNVHGYANPLFIKCWAQPESDLGGVKTLNNCCCLRSTSAWKQDAEEHLVPNRKEEQSVPDGEQRAQAWNRS
ncbi:hypothetical protein EJB05_09295 [Eragrostis curvula]|uniref:Uncharacterized protein n=1 Tax=Eragrostis curvula TaxID=38414 RepID=A0A5J9W2B6_9POAL|nr:hypothetical protein EJB05_09295 [Eragrostis curvula]